MKEKMFISVVSLFCLAFMTAQASAYGPYVETNMGMACISCHTDWGYGGAWHNNHDGYAACATCHASYVPEVYTAACTTCHPLSGAGKCAMVNNHEDDGFSCVMCHPECSTLAEFASLKAFSLLKRVVLQWETIVEMDNVAFLIQRSTDGENYESIATVPSKANNMGAASYTYVDKPGVSGTVSYKVVDIDTTGNKTDHGPVEVNVK